MTAVHSDDLELLERLGGSSATVHRAVLRTTGRVVVVKRAGWDRPDVADRLGREAVVLRRVQHPSLVRLLDVVEDDTGRSLVLAHAPGGSLANRLHLLGPLAPADVADLGGRVSRALAALHRRGVVHRDVHQGNVLIDAELQPVLADLDNALDTRGAPLPGDREVVGSATHVDPHVLAGAPAGPASDLHALAATLWTAATGTPPPRAGPESPVDIPDDARVPAPLAEVLRDCLDGSAGDAATVAGRLEGIAVELLQAPTTSPDIPAAPPPRGPTPAPRGLVAGGVGGSGDPVTRRWGPAPRPEPLTTVEPGRSGRLVLTGAVLLVALAGLGWRVLSSDDPRTPAGTATPVVAVAPAPCATAHVPDGRPPASTGSDAAPVLADLDGDGCSEVVRLVDGELHTADARYHLGRPGDVLLAGDWDGDGRWSVGLYRPATGAVYLFDAAPGAGARSRPAQQHPSGGTPHVIEMPDGGHGVEVTPTS